MQGHHLPVMADEVVSLVVTRTDGLYVDCTVGGGGHAARLLNNAPAGRLLGIEVLDHVIIGDGEYVSFRERGIGALSAGVQ